MIGGDGSLVYKWQNGIRVEVDHEPFDPFLFGTIYIKGTSEDFIDLVRTNQDSYDIQQIKSCNIESITETVNEIVKLIEYAQNQSTIPHATFSAAFGLYMNLIYVYPTKKTLVNQLISGKISGQSHNLQQGYLAELKGLL